MDDLKGQSVNHDQLPDGIWFRFKFEVGASKDALERMRDVVAGVKAICEEAKPWLPIILPLLGWLVQLIIIGFGPFIS